MSNFKIGDKVVLSGYKDSFWNNDTSFRYPISEAQLKTFENQVLTVSKISTCGEDIAVRDLNGETWVFYKSEVRYASEREIEQGGILNTFNFDKEVDLISNTYVLKGRDNQLYYAYYQNILANKTDTVILCMPMNKPNGSIWSDYYTKSYFKEVISIFPRQPIENKE